MLLNDGGQRLFSSDWDKKFENCADLNESLVMACVLETSWNDAATS
jgi:hypothetical protein